MDNTSEETLVHAKPIVGYGSPILKTTSIEVENNPENVQKMVDLFHTLKSLKTCVGLASVQINDPLRMFIVAASKQGAYIVINPTITKRRMKQNYEEGCMSIPKTFAKVEGRDDIIDIEYYDSSFNKVKKRIRGFESIIFQHEYDHLNGVLFTDRLTKEGRESIADKLSEIERGIAPTYYDMIFPGTDVIHKKD